MAIIRWNPRSLSNIFDDDWEFPTIPGISRLGQGLNLYETADSLVAEAALPGIKDGDIDVTIDDGVVRITATTSDSTEEKSQRRYFMSSMASSFNYSFRLPEGINQDKEPTAELKNGVLQVIFQKIAKTPPKKVRIVTKDEPKTEVKK